MYWLVDSVANQDVAWDCPTRGCGYNPSDPGTNYGRCVDIYAPAWNLNVASASEQCAYRSDNTKSGTSWAAPTVAGVVARLLQAYPTLSVTGVWNRLNADATIVTPDLDLGPNNVNHKLLFASPTLY